MDDAAYLTGQYLVAMPGMSDPRFRRAVIAMCAHSAEGAMGICIGAEHNDLRFHDLLRRLGIDPGGCDDVAIHVGGPVEPERGFVLHSADWGGQDSVAVAGSWVLTSTIDSLRAIAEGRGPKHWLVAMGYAGWEAGQLETELGEHVWLSVGGDASIIFGPATASPWVRCLEQAGIDPVFLANHGGNA